MIKKAHQTIDTFLHVFATHLLAHNTLPVLQVHILRVPTLLFTKGSQDLLDKFHPVGNGHILPNANFLCCLYSTLLGNRAC